MRPELDDDDDDDAADVDVAVVADVDDEATFALG